MTNTSHLTPSDLVVLAREAAKNAHAPYSKYGVGAAVLMADGTVITGCNFENASYGLTLCAETVALGTANAAGRLKDVRAISALKLRLGAGQTGQQLLIGAYQALERQIALGNVAMYNRHEMLDVVKIDGKARGIIVRNLVSGKLERHFGHAVLLCSGGYGNVFYLSTNAMGSNVTAAWKDHKKGAYFGNPCFTQIHPT